MSARLPFPSLSTSALLARTGGLHTAVTVIGTGSFVVRLPLAFAVPFPALAGTRILHRSIPSRA